MVFETGLRHVLTRLLIGAWPHPEQLLQADHSVSRPPFAVEGKYNDKFESKTCLVRY